MCSNLTGVRVISGLISRSCRNYLINKCRTKIIIKFYNDCLLEPSLKIFLPILTQNFVNYASLQNKDSEGSVKKKNKGGLPILEEDKDPIISLVKENNGESVVKLSVAKKYAKQRNMELVQLESSRTRKVKYKLVEKPDVLGRKRIQDKALKTITVREEIQPHDLDIKINKMITLVEKKLQVMCLIETTEGQTEKSENILNALNKSQLKDHFVRKTKAKKGFFLLYKKKSENSKKPEGEKMGDVESS